MLKYAIAAQRIDVHGSEAQAKSAAITLDTDLGGRADAFNPAELLLASLAACMLKGIERTIPIIEFDLRGVSVNLSGLRQDKPPKMISVTYEISVDTDETEHRLNLLHKNVRKYGTIYNTLAESVGTMTRKIKDSTTP